MKNFVGLLMGGVMLAGCAGPKSRPDAPAEVARARKNQHDKIIMTPETMLVGKVVQVNEKGRFAVLNFPVGSLPGINQHMSVYRQGLKVGEVKVTSWQLNDDAVADIVSGEVQVGDELRGN